MRFRPKLLAAAAAALACAACASAPPGQPLAMRPPELLSAPPPPFTRQGEIQFTPSGTAGSSAAWDGRSVRGPAVNLTLTEGGLWGGTIQDRVVLLHARNGRITGQGVEVSVTQDGSVVRVQGLWFGRLVGITFTPGSISASPLTGVCAQELSLAPDGLWRGFGGCGGTLDYIWMSLNGVAADPAGEMPQWFFAFLGALPGPRVATFRPGAVASGAPVMGINGFLPAEFRALPYQGEPPAPCSYWDQRLCGPWGYTGLRPDQYRYRGGAVAVESGGRPSRPAGAPRPAAGVGRSGSASGAPSGRGAPGGSEARAARTTSP